jgi:hypothetical protein
VWPGLARHPVLLLDKAQVGDLLTTINHWTEEELATLPGMEHALHAPSLQAESLLSMKDSSHWILLMNGAGPRLPLTSCYHVNCRVGCFSWTCCGARTPHGHLLTLSVKLSRAGVDKHLSDLARILQVLKSTMGTTKEDARGEVLSPRPLNMVPNMKKTAAAVLHCRKPFPLRPVSCFSHDHVELPKLHPCFPSCLYLQLVYLKSCT